MIIVQKFGGTSVADLGRLEAVALRVKQEWQKGHQLAVVVSAMAGVTNQLVGYVRALAGDTLCSEYDVVASAGEQITAGLLALALQQIQVPARSFLAWQIPLLTDEVSGQARVQSINKETLIACWVEGMIPVIAGFQGITSTQRVTTLGRGGSDTSAVALAAALKADRCDIYTDVPGIFTADPRIVSQARKIESLTYDEMLNLAEEGAKVLHAPCVALAKEHQVPLYVRSSFDEDQGTFVVGTSNPNSTHLAGLTHQMGWMCLEIEASLLFEGAKDILKPFLTTLGSYLYESPHPQLSLGIFCPQDRLLSITTLLSSYGIDIQQLQLHRKLAKITLVGVNLTSKREYVESLIKLINQDNLPLTLVCVTKDRFILHTAEEEGHLMINHLHHALRLDECPPALFSSPLAQQRHT